MPLGDALTLVFTEPLWTLILSKLVLKISIGVWKMLFGLVLLGGMVLCIQPPFLFPVESSLPLPAKDNNSTLGINDPEPGIREVVNLFRHVVLAYEQPDDK